MFTLKIHTVDFPPHQPLRITSSVAINLKNGTNPEELVGASHLYRRLPSTYAFPAAATVENVTVRTTLVYVVAVPNYLSSDDFLVFCGTHITYFDQIIFLRNDGMEDRYSVLILLENQLAADGFYCCYNGKRFKPSEFEVCHIYFSQSVDYTESEEIATIPPPQFTELPSCPVCIERLDPDTSGIRSTLCDHSYHCSCPSKWTYMSCPVCRLCQQQDEKLSCAVCGTFKNPWICLICGFVGCGRYEKGHANGHCSDKQHHFSLELETRQVWDYVRDKYVHRLNQAKTDKISAMGNSRSNPVKECGTCGNDEEEGLDDALFSSKIEAILDEYNRLLANQLDIQRKHYESLLDEAKDRKERSSAKAVEKAIFSRTHDLQFKLEKHAEDKKSVTDRNEELVKKQESLQNKLKEIEERERSSLKSKDEKIMDLQEQIRDLKVYVEAQKTFASMPDSDGIKGGTVLPVESNQTPAGNPKRRNKSGRVRGRN